MISFTNTSTTTISVPHFRADNWDFGDGTYSNFDNPNHYYSTIGTYNVRLNTTIFDSTTYTILCRDTVFNNVVVSVANTLPCEALFAANRDTSMVPSTLEYYFEGRYSYSGGGGSITSYAWDFGDGNTGTGTNPLHTYATAGVYNVCLTITTSNSCTDTYCLLLDVKLPTPITAAGSHLMGRVVPSSSIGALAYLIEYNPVTQNLYAIGSRGTTNFGIDQGYFSFAHIPSGNPYLVKAAYLTRDPLYATHLPTYYMSNALWSGATNVTATGLPINLTINMLAGSPTIGPGFIGGNVLTGANKTTGPGDPKYKLTVLLFDVTDNKFIAMDRTDINGEYSFSNVPIGTYKIFLEELGKTMTAADIAISATQSSFTKVDFESNSTENHPMAPLNVTNQQFMSNYKLIGNPAKNNFTLSGLKGGELVQILDINGKVLKKYQNTKSNDIFDITGFSSGIYIVNVKKNQAIKNFKLVIAQ